MNFETASALHQAEQVFASYKSDFDFVRLSSLYCSTHELTRENWDQMCKKFDMEVVLLEDEQLRRFLPRLLEWLIEEFASNLRFGLGRWDLGRRLNDARWLEWPEVEVEALRAVFEAWTRDELTRPEGKVPLDFLAELEDDLARYLEIWLKNRPHELAQWLWTVNLEKREDVRLWAVTPHVEAALEAEFFRHPDGPRAQLISRTIELIRSLRC